MGDTSEKIKVRVRLDVEAPPLEIPEEDAK